MTYTNAWGNEIENLLNVDGAVGILSEGPPYLFPNPQEPGDFALAPGSNCIDGGDPGDPCGDEPGGADCRVDMGHLGGTEDGQVR